MLKKISKNDYRLFFRLSSLYEAITFSATNPVSIWQGLGKTFHGKNLGQMAVFYDCCDDEGKAREIIAQRITLAEQDIRKHYQAHKKASGLFYTLEESMNTRNRKWFNDACLNLCQTIGSYTDMIPEHQRRLKNKAFLEYPNCLPGHYFHIPCDSRILELSFNPEVTYEGAFRDLSTISETIIDNLTIKSEMPYIKLSTQNDTGEGITDTSLRGRLELNKELLKRAGLNLEPE